MQKWPDERMLIYARAIPNAASLVQSLLSPNLVILNSISNLFIKSSMIWGQFDKQNIKCSILWGQVDKQNIKCSIDLELMTRPSGGGVFMFCIVINCLSSEMTLGGLLTRGDKYLFRVKVEKGRWALVGYFNEQGVQSGDKFIILCYNKQGEEIKVEKALVVRGEEQIPVETVHSLLSLFC